MHPINPQETRLILGLGLGTVLLQVGLGLAALRERTAEISSVPKPRLKRRRSPVR